MTVRLVSCYSPVIVSITPTKMLATCTQCQHDIVQVTESDPLYEWDVHHLVCSNKNCINADPAELAEETFFEKADREYQLSNDLQHA